MVKILQHQRRTLLPAHTETRFPIDESFWTRLWGDEWFQSPFRTLMSLPADWIPDIDIAATDTNIIVEANIAGYELKEIDVEIDDNILTIQGKREGEKEDQGKTYYRRERCAGSFFRRIVLPPVDAAKATCHVKNGTLTVLIPKKETEKSARTAHKIAIQS